MKLIAANTVQGRKTLRAPDPKNSKDRGRHQTTMVAPGAEFDTADLGISDDEALAMIASGAAKRKMREVTDADHVEAGAGAGANAT
ncbi:hypothetical protein [Bradyrhizobium sp. JYMT SZCCT0428]|uniref:hypothetical protein n=1 Tax=Bradyrhizobium sp. JYMT SZCCT0428 TaxID=2807673 RepID=UPI001BA52013|nr:hypothetical protein [Bradyrhizobium sp. JYMT SZCCT0428]MBR1150096.1 hypothetical protein [Bradyrhizobium sp. JYMT SZCCT0428]